MNTKICKQCGEEFPATTQYFHIDKKGKFGITNICKACRNNIYRLKRVKQKVKDGYKICTKCHKELPATIEYFTIKKKCKYGVASQCKQCDQKYYEDNKERILKRQKQYSENNKAKISKYRKEYREKNIEKLLKQNKLYYLNNIEKFREYEKKNKDRIEIRRKQYRKNNKEKFKFYSKKRDAIKRKLPHNLTVEQWGKCKQYFNNRCAYCGRTLPLHQEHFIPLSKGGEYTINNIIPACKSCNSSKRDKNFFEWYKTHKYYSNKRENKILKYLNYTENKQQLSILK